MTPKEAHLSCYERAEKSAVEKTDTRRPTQHSPLELRAQLAKAIPSPVVVGHGQAKASPKLRAVAVVAADQMAKLVRDHVVDERGRCLDDAPVQADLAGLVAASPSSLLIAYEHWRNRDLELLRPGRDVSG